METPGVEYELELPPLYPAQHAAICDPKRIAIIEASTKSGKSAGALIWLLALAWNDGGPGRNYWWVAPIRATAKAIGYNRMGAMLRQADPHKRTWFNWDSELYIQLANGARVWFKGAEEPDSLYGEDVHAVVIDEATRVKEASWHAVRSTLTHTKGPVRIIGNVVGAKNWVYRLAREAQKGRHADIGVHRLTAYDAVEGGVLDAKEIEDARRVLPDAVFRQLYLAIASDGGGGMYYAFDYDANVRPCPYDPAKTIIVGCDFNISPMAWALMHRSGPGLDVFDEIFLNDCTTRHALDVLHGKYCNHKGGFEFYGDATSRQRKTSASNSDYQQIYNDVRFQRLGRTVSFDESNPRVKDRVEGVNALLKTASGDRRLHVDPRCEAVIRDLEYCQWKEGTFEKDESDKSLTHISDAIGYAVWHTHPMRAQLARRAFAPVTTLSGDY